MNSPITAYDLGRIPYREALEFQRRAVAERASNARGDAIYFVEHEPLLPVGRAGHAENLLIPESLLRARGVEVVPIERGGDVTYHGPGQIVGYPIVALDGLPGGRDMHRYLRDLEDVLILMLTGYGISAGRRPPYTGVWVGDRKVAAIGVAVKRWITLHGFALKLGPDLTHLDWIPPPRIPDPRVTSMPQLLGQTPPPPQGVCRACAAFAKIWDRPIVESHAEENLHA